jgi:hypothetical protein
MYRQTNLDVVNAVACQSVDLVDDHVADVTFFVQTSEERLQRGPIRRTSGRASVDILLENRGAKLLSLAATRLSLSRNRIALYLAA